MKKITEGFSEADQMFIDMGFECFESDTEYSYSSNNTQKYFIVIDIHKITGDYSYIDYNSSTQIISRDIHKAIHAKLNELVVD